MAKNRFDANSIILSVIIFHLAALAWLVVDGTKQTFWDKEQKRKIAIKSVIFLPADKDAFYSKPKQVALQQQQGEQQHKVAMAAPQPAMSKPAAPSKQPIKQQPAAEAKPIKQAVEKVFKQKESQKKTTIKGKTQEASSSSSAPMEAQNKIFQEKLEQKNALLQRAKESIAKLPHSNHAIDSERLSFPTMEEACLSPEGCYATELATALQRQLSLPEWGSVEVEITINRQGRVIKATILKTENIKNSAYLEGAFPKVTAAAFGTRFATENSHTFVLTLTN